MLYISLRVCAKLITFKIWPVCGLTKIGTPTGTRGVNFPNTGLNFRTRRSPAVSDPIEHADVLGPIKAEPFGWPRKTRSVLTGPPRGGCEDGRMLAARVEPKNGPQENKMRSVRARRRRFVIWPAALYSWGHGETSQHKNVRVANHPMQLVLSGRSTQLRACDFRHRLSWRRGRK